MTSRMILRMATKVEGLAICSLMTIAFILTAITSALPSELAEALCL